MTSGWRPSGGGDALVLHDDGLYEHLRDRVVPYPFELSRRTIEAHLHVLPCWVIEGRGLGLGDLVGSSMMVCRQINRILGVLGGLNGVYLSTEKGKRTDELFRRMTIALRSVAERCRALLHGDREHVADELDRLQRETLERVATERPDIDLEPARRMLDLAIQPALVPLP